MCALDAAGFEPNAGIPANVPELAELKLRMSQQQGPATDALKKFYREHELSGAGETLSRYISVGLVLGPPPRFPYVLEHDILPPDVLTVEGFNQVLANFYREAKLNVEWARYSPIYDRELTRYESPTRRALFVAAGYLRELMAPKGGRMFTVDVEPLTGSHINFRNYEEHYSIVVGSPTELPIDDIRHAYIHFLIDPLVLKNRNDIDKKSALLQVAGKAPGFPVEYEHDFIGFFDECMVKSVELRLRKMTPADLEKALAESDRTGMVLIRPLVTELKIFEKEGPAMNYYFPEIVKHLDVESELARLKTVKFAAAEPPKPHFTDASKDADAKPAATSAANPETDLERDLDSGDRQIALQNGAGARQIFETILAAHPDLPRAEYGLAMASVLQGKASRAEELFEKLVQDSKSGNMAVADPTILAWSHVYLGRIHDLRGDRDLALDEYSAALAIEGAPAAARTAAEHGQAEPYGPGARPPDTARP
jgi:hypothetical protein